VAITKAAEGRLASLPSRVRGTLVPVVVTAGPLFQLGYDDAGDEILHPVLWQRLIWQGSSVRQSATVVDIVTVDHLEAYARMMLPALQAIASALEDLPPSRWVA
jgi:hypothetical protein